MNWFAALFKRKEPGTVNDRYAMKLSVCHEIYTVEEFDLQFKRNTCVLYTSPSPRDIA